MSQTTFMVEGMTCGHCVESVRSEVGGVAGVASVDVDLVTGGSSTVTVTSEEPVDRRAVRAAVAAAGYRLV